MPGEEITQSLEQKKAKYVLDTEMPLLLDTKKVQMGLKTKPKGKYMNRYIEQMDGAKGF